MFSSVRTLVLLRSMPMGESMMYMVGWSTPLGGCLRRLRSIETKIIDPRRVNTKNDDLFVIVKYCYEL